VSGPDISASLANHGVRVFSSSSYPKCYLEPVLKVGKLVELTLGGRLGGLIAKFQPPVVALNLLRDQLVQLVGNPADYGAFLKKLKQHVFHLHSPNIILAYAKKEKLFQKVPSNKPRKTVSFLKTEPKKRLTLSYVPVDISQTSPYLAKSYTTS